MPTNVVQTEFLVPHFYFNSTCILQDGTASFSAPPHPTFLSFIIFTSHSTPQKHNKRYGTEKLAAQQRWTFSSEVVDRLLDKGC